MGNPEMTNRMRNGPLQALRTVFAGIGRILMAADRPERTSSTGRRGSSANGFGSGHRPVQPATTATQSQARWRSLDETGNVRLLSTEDFEDGLYERPNRPAPTAPAAAVPEVARAEPDMGALDFADPVDLGSAALDFTGPTPAEADTLDLTGPMAADAQAAEAAASDTQDLSPVSSPAEEPAAEPALPLPAYDSLSLPSIRARLRGLDSHQLRVLVAYEQSHAERPEVLGMFERRIEKLEAGG